YNPVVRCQAACAIGYHGDKALPEIEKAIRSKDARVRQAGLRGLSGYMTFFMDRSPFTYTEEGMAKMVPLIVGALKNPEADIWELDAALFAMSEVPPKEIVKNFDVIAPFLKHDEWWLRTGAFLAICETGADAAPVAPELIECFVREEHGWPRQFYHLALKTLIREDQP
ncbi:MAG: HEAT repeat domain-containing protein, partial [bacterium]|nr:HEAT repeat domain-containing protein [bacterium]